MINSLICKVEQTNVYFNNAENKWINYIRNKFPIDSEKEREHKSIVES